MFSFRKRFSWRGDQLADSGRKYAAKLSRMSAEYLLGRAQMHAPVDTGFLHNSGKVLETKGGAKTSVIFAADYVQYVEFGYVTSTGTFVPPNPFFRTAIADTVSAFPSLAGQLRLEAPGDGNSLESLGVSTS